MPVFEHCIVVPLPGQVPLAPMFAAVDQVVEVGQAEITLPLASELLEVVAEVQVAVQVAVGEVRYEVVPVPTGHWMVVPLPGQVALAPSAAAVDQVPEVEQVVTLPLASAVLDDDAPLKLCEQVAVGEVR